MNRVPTSTSIFQVGSDVVTATGCFLTNIMRLTRRLNIARSLLPIGLFKIRLVTCCGVLFMNKINLIWKPKQSVQ